MSEQDETDHTPRQTTSGNDDAGPGLFGDASPPAAQPGYVVLARKYRPSSFDDLIGQDAMVRTLRNAFAIERIAQAYMLTGVRGVGKTTTARILARALNYAGPDGSDRPSVDLASHGRHCREIIESRHPDVIEMDAASNTGVDNIREIIEDARYRPIVARYKVFIIDEVHMLSKGAFNALLKTLEEPPPHVKFIFATTEIRRVPVTVLSRCQRFDLRRVDVDVLAAHFKRIVAKEGAEAEDAALAVIARAAEGSVRDGLSILDQAIAMGAGRVTEAGVRSMLGLADRGRIFELLELVLAGDVRGALELFGGLYRDGADPLQTLADLGEAVHIATRVRVAGPDAAGEGLSAEDTARAAAVAAKVATPVLSRAWQMLLKGLEEANRAPSPVAAAEMVLIRLAHAADLPSPEEIIRRLGAGSGSSGRAPGRDGGERGGGDRSGGERDRQAPMNVATGAPAEATAARSARVAGPASAPPPPWEAEEAAPVQDAGAARGRDDEPPPPASLDDYGLAAPEPDPFDADVGPEDDPETMPAAGAGLDDPRSFEDVVAVAGRRRDARLKVHLEEHVSLVKFDVAGAIEVALLPGAPPEIANELREKLNKWTGRRWMVAVSRSRGEPTLGEVRRAREAEELEALKKHPALAELMGQFPGARITVRPLTVHRDDDDEQAAG